jgi:putative sporulation protein YtaF
MIPHFVYIFFIALANNLDNLGVRVAYSIQGIRMSNVVNLWISVITFIISYFSAYSGKILRGFLSAQLCSVVTMIILSAIGVGMILMPWIKRTCNIKSDQGQKSFCRIVMKLENADRDDSKHIDFKEATVLGIALSLNNLGGGISAGMIGLDSFWVALFSAALSYLALWAGNNLADFFIRWNLANKATIVAGIMLIAIGLEQML